MADPFYTAPHQAYLDSLTSGNGLSLTPSAVQTANYSAAAGEIVPVNTTSGAVTVTLPSAPADQTAVAVKHIIQGGTNAVTVARGGTDVFNKAGGSTSLSLALVNQACLLEYQASTGIWYVLADDMPLAGLDARFAASGQGSTRVVSAGSLGAAPSLTLSSTGVDDVLYTGTISATGTLTVSGGNAGASFTLQITCDGTHTLTLPDASTITGVAAQVVTVGGYFDGSVYRYFTLGSSPSATQSVQWYFATVATQESIASSTYGDLTTAGPSITVTVPTNGLVSIVAEVDMFAVGGTARVGISDGPTDLASPVAAVLSTAVASAEKRATASASSSGSIITANKTQIGPFFATAGSRTYTLKYSNATNGQTATYANRKIAVAVITPS